MAEQPKPVTGYPYPAVQPHNAGAGYFGTAAPYQAPAPPYYQNPYPTQPFATSYFDPRRRATIILRRLIAVLIGIFLVIGAFTLILWLVLRPHLPEFSVNSAAVSPFNITGEQLTANFDFNISVRNPNKKMGIYYDRIEAAVFYRSVPLASAPLEPFFQGHRNQTALRLKLATLSQFVENGKAANMAADRSQGEVNFNLRLLAWVRFRAGAWRTRRHLMRVYCGSVKIGWNGKSNSTAVGGGSLLGESRCAVDL